MAKRLGLYFLGILILGFGIVLNTKNWFRGCGN